MPRAVVPLPASVDLSALLKLAVASVDYGGPRPKLLSIEFLQGLVNIDVLAAEDQAFVERLIQPKQRQADRQRTRTCQPLMVFPYVNCDADVVDAPWLYCCPLCNEMAKTVRYGRGVYADGRIKDPDIQEALQIRMASVNGGGYPSAQRQLAPEQRQAILGCSARSAIVRRPCLTIGSRPTPSTSPGPKSCTAASTPPAPNAHATIPRPGPTPNGS